MDNFHDLFLYNFNWISFSIDNYFIPNNFFDFCLNIWDVMMNIYFFNSNNFFSLRNHLLHNLRHWNNMSDFICNVDRKLFLESNRDRHLDWMHNNTVIIHYFHVLYVKIFDSIFEDFNRYFLLLNYDSLISNLLRLHNCLRLQVLHKHLLRHDSLLFDCQIHYPLHLDLDWNLNHTWLLDYSFDRRQLFWNLYYLFDDLLDNLRHLNDFLYNSRNNYNLLNNFLDYLSSWYFHNLFDNFFNSLYFWLDPVIIEGDRDSFLFFYKDWSLFFDIMRYSRGYFNCILLFNYFWLRDGNRDMDFFDDFIDERYIIDLFLNFDHLNEKRSLHIFNDLLRNFFLYRHVLGSRNLNYLWHLPYSHHLLFNMNFLRLTLNDSFNRNYLFNYAVFRYYFLFGLNQLYNLFMGFLDDF